MLERIPLCSTNGSGAAVTGWVGAATGLLSAVFASARFASAGLVSCALRLRRMDERAIAEVMSCATEAWMVSARPPRRKSQYAKPKPEIAPRKLRSLVFSRLKQGLKNA